MKPTAKRRPELDAEPVRVLGRGLRAQRGIVWRLLELTPRTKRVGTAVTADWETSHYSPVAF